MRVNRIKKSGNPTEPDHRSNTSTPTEQRKQDNIIHEFMEIFKRASWGKRLLLPFVTLAGLVIFAIKNFVSFFKRSEYTVQAAILLVLCLAGVLIFTICTGGNDTAKAPDEHTASDSITASAEVCPEKRYTITDAERREIASVITAEAVGEPYAGKVAVAQCILQASEDDGIRPCEVVKKYAYSKHRPEPCKEALEAVQAVFDLGQVSTPEPIKYFYAPARVRSSWHESQVYVMTINNHKFFKEAK